VLEVISSHWKGCGPYIQDEPYFADGIRDRFLHGGRVARAKIQLNISDATFDLQALHRTTFLLYDPTSPVTLVSVF
jgi:hypothetical protein